MTDSVSGNGKKPMRIPLGGGEGEREVEFQLLKDPEKGFTAIAVRDVVSGHVILEVVLPDDSMIREAEILGHDPDHKVSNLSILWSACHLGFNTILTALQIAMESE